MLICDLQAAAMQPLCCSVASFLLGAFGEQPLFEVRHLSPVREQKLQKREKYMLSARTHQ